MKAMVFSQVGQPLQLEDVPVPEPRENEVLLRVRACGVCRTDLHIVDGELDHPKLPLILGHQIVGVVGKLGGGVTGHKVGDRVGVPWLGKTCGCCAFCKSGKENLCDDPVFTGYSKNGGFAEYSVVDASYCFPITSDLPDEQVAPLLCAGLIGYRAYCMTGKGKRLGLYGFGSAAHIIAQVALHEGKEVYAFTRPEDEKGQAFARELGCVWAGGSDTSPPEALDAAIIFAPVGALVPAALKAVKKGGVVVCAGIHMSDIPQFPYADLWEERVVRSVANLTRADGHAFLALAPTIPVRTQVKVYPLEEANEALEDLRRGRIKGSAVLWIAE